MNPFPAHWSLEQVIAVDQFLLHLREQLWRQYRHDLQPLFGGDDDIPTSASPSDATFQYALFDDTDLPF